MSNRVGSHLLDKKNRDSIIGAVPSVTDQEAEAVAEAVGLPKIKVEDDAQLSQLSKVQSLQSNVTSEPESPSPEGPLSPADEIPELSARVWKDPKPGSLDGSTGGVEGNVEAGQRSVSEEDEALSRLAAEARIEGQPGHASATKFDED